MLQPVEVPLVELAPNAGLQLRELGVELGDHFGRVHTENVAASSGPCRDLSDDPYPSVYGSSCRKKRPLSAPTSLRSRAVTSRTRCTASSPRRVSGSADRQGKAVFAESAHRRAFSVGARRGRSAVRV